MFNSQVNISTWFLQVESNGVLSVSDNHLLELEQDKFSKPPKKLQESDRVHSLDEFNDEEVFFCQPAINCLFIYLRLGSVLFLEYSCRNPT